MYVFQKYKRGHWKTMEVPTITYIVHTCYFFVQTLYSPGTNNIVTEAAAAAAVSIIILKHFFHSSPTCSIFVCLYYFTERARSSQSEVIPLFDVRQTSGILVSILRCFSNGSNFCTYIHNNIHYTCYQIIRYYCRRFSSNAHIIQRSSVIPNPLHRAFNITIKPYTRIVLFQHLNIYMIFIYVSLQLSCLLVSNERVHWI